MRVKSLKFLWLVVAVSVFAVLLAVDTPIAHFGKFEARPARAAAVTLLMAILWLTEAIPIYLTACIPLVLFPALGVFGGSFGDECVSTVRPYVDAYIFLFMGGMCIAAAMQQWNLHRRLALTVMRAIGTDPKRLLLGVLSSSAFISLWISNTATAAMMVPIGVAIVAQCERHGGGRRLVEYGAVIMMSIAYGSNIGGIGTKIGTAPNAQFAQFMSGIGVDVTFSRFMAVGLPFVALFIPISWAVLWWSGRRDAPRGQVGAEAVADEIRKLGPIQRGEWIVLSVFVATAAMWIGAKPITEWLQPRVAAFKLTSAHVEGGIAMLAAFVLMAWPVGGRRALDLRSLRFVPWETLLLLGGAFSMASGVQSSGLSDWIGDRLHVLRELGPFQQVLLASAATVALSAVTSNTATIGVMLSVLKDSVSPGHLTTVLFAATIASSCDFMLPAGTPPNAIVFGTGYVTIPKMAKTGAVLDLLAAVVAAAWCWISVSTVFGA